MGCVLHQAAPKCSIGSALLALQRVPARFQDERLATRLNTILDLSLGGTLTNSYKDRLLQPNPDYKAEVKLGVRF